MTSFVCEVACEACHAMEVESGGLLSHPDYTLFTWLGSGLPPGYKYRAIREPFEQCQRKLLKLDIGY